jgi:hypothetical protein
MSLVMFLAKWWDARGTAILGFLTSFVAGIVVIPNLIPPERAPYWAAANLALGLLTMKRSNTNKRKLADTLTNKGKGDEEK